ncbi:nucleotide exchange factor GrpE [bacterium]|nr:nucleotide exchange factor GrpE [bacterium]
MSETVENENVTETGNSEDSTVSQTADELTALREELAKTKEQLKRVAAEADNFRRRQESNFEKRLDSAKDDLVRKFLPFMDNLEMAIKAAQEKGDINALRTGVEMVHKNMIKILADLGIHPIEAVGETFNPSWHEAVMMEQREDLPDETIVAEFNRGYKCGDRVIRPSMVKVARNGQTPTP